MKHDGASRTLIRLIDGVFPISDLIHCKLRKLRTNGGKAELLSPRARSRPRPPRCHRTILLSPPMLWKAAAHRIMMRADGSPWLPCFPLVCLSANNENRRKTNPKITPHGIHSSSGVNSSCLRMHMHHAHAPLLWCSHSFSSLKYHHHVDSIRLWAFITSLSSRQAGVKRTHSMETCSRGELSFGTPLLWVGRSSILFNFDTYNAINPCYGRGGV
jgi:hypothetical protein